MTIGGLNLRSTCLPPYDKDPLRIRRYFNSREWPQDGTCNGYNCRKRAERCSLLKYERCMMHAMPLRYIAKAFRLDANNTFHGHNSTICRIIGPISQT